MTEQEHNAFPRGRWSTHTHEPECNSFKGELCDCPAGNKKTAPAIGANDAKFEKAHPSHDHDCPALAGGICICVAQIPISPKQITDADDPDAETVSVQALSVASAAASDLVKECNLAAEAANEAGDNLLWQTLIWLMEDAVRLEQKLQAIERAKG